MFRLKFLLKLSAGIINAFIILLTIAIVSMGVIHSIDAVSILIEYIQTHDTNLRPGIAIIETLDIFLIALVFLIFSIGISRLFIKHGNDKFDQSLPKWLRIDNFSELKYLLMEAIISMLFIITITVIVKEGDGPSIKWLYVPGIIIMLSISLRLLKWKK